MNERILAILKNPLTIPVGVGIGSFLGGLGTGFLLGKRKTHQEYEAHVIPCQEEWDIEEEVQEPVPGIIDGPHVEIEEVPQPPASPEDIQAFIDRKVEDGELVLPDVPKFVPHFEIEPDGTTRQNLIQEDGSVQQVVIERDEEPVDPVRQNVFAHNDDDWNMDEELAKRDPGQPYILHRDEFYAEERGFTQTTLTWYEGDKIMCDQEEVPLYNWQREVGPLRFGHGSGGKDLFYVRNEKNRAEYEVIRLDDRYDVAVLGQEIEDSQTASDLRHSRTPTRFRPDG